ISPGAVLPGGVVFPPGGGVFPTPSPAGTSSPPSQTVPAALQALLLSIPVAEDGQVIRADHHNLLRAAVIALANQLGITGLGQPSITTFAPALLPTNRETPWVLENGVAHKPDGAAEGWMPVALLDDARISGMTVFGRRSGAIDTRFEVKLLRQSIADSTTITL